MRSSQVPAIRGIKYLEISGHLNNHVVRQTTRRTPAPPCVAQAGSPLAGTSAMIPSFTSRRCAPSPCAAPAPSRDSPGSAGRPHLCEFVTTARDRSPASGIAGGGGVRLPGGPGAAEYLLDASGGVQRPGKLKLVPYPPRLACNSSALHGSRCPQAPPLAQRRPATAAPRRRSCWASSPPPSPSPTASPLSTAVDFARYAPCAKISGRRVREATRAAVGAARCRRCCRLAARASRPARARLTTPRFPRGRRSQRRRSAAAARRAGCPRRTLGVP